MSKEYPGSPGFSPQDVSAGWGDGIRIWTGRAALHEFAQPRSGVGNFEARETATLRIEDDDLVLAGRQIDTHEDIV